MMALTVKLVSAAAASHSALTSALTRAETEWQVMEASWLENEAVRDSAQLLPLLLLLWSSTVKMEGTQPLEPKPWLRYEAAAG